MFKLLKFFFVLAVVGGLLGLAFVFGQDSQEEVAAPDYEIPPERRGQWEAWQQAREVAMEANVLLSRFKQAQRDIQRFSSSRTWQEVRQRADLADPQALQESLAELERIVEQAETGVEQAKDLQEVGQDEIEAIRTWAEELETELELRKLLEQYMGEYRMDQGRPVLPESAPKEDKEKLDALLEETPQP
jgi:hypothetical protein